MFCPCLKTFKLVFFLFMVLPFFSLFSFRVYDYFNLIIDVVFINILSTCFPNSTINSFFFTDLYRVYSTIINYCVLLLFYSKRLAFVNHQLTQGQFPLEQLMDKCLTEGHNSGSRDSNLQSTSMLP